MSPRDGDLGRLLAVATNDANFPPRHQSERGLPEEERHGTEGTVPCMLAGFHAAGRFPVHRLILTSGLCPDLASCELHTSHVS